MLRRRLHQLFALSAIAAAGVATSLVGAAQAYTTDQLGSLGYSVTVTILNADGSCRNWFVSGHGGAQDLGSDCDAGFQQRLDAFVNATCPCAQTTAATSTAAATTTTTTTDTTTTTTSTSTTTPAPTTTADPGSNPPPPTVTTTVTTSSPATLPPPPAADFTAATVNPDVVQFTDASTSGTPLTSRVWQFGDGVAGSGSSITHPYAGPGVYEVTLIVVDSSGLTSAAVHELTINADQSINLGPRQTQAAAKTSAAKRAAAKRAAAKKAAAKAARSRKLHGKG